MIVVAGVLVVITLIYAVCRYSFLLPRVDGIPVLMYHKVSVSARDFLTVTDSDFIAQLEWLNSQGYQSISMKQFLSFAEGKVPRDALPKNPILITFDDGYESNVSLALPILKRFHNQATLFVTSSYIEQAQSGADPQYLNVDQLKEWVANGMELALHSHNHPNYRQISSAAVVEDLKLNHKKLDEWHLPVHPVLAYPFGARPKNIEDRNELKKTLAANSVRAAFRIGNKTHSFSEFQSGIDRYDICRIDVRGDDPFFEFKIKVLKGRSKLF